jgi:signal transduction histidine kinase
MPFNEEQTLRALRMLIAELSLEIGTPSNAIIGLSKLILEGGLGPLNEEQREGLFNIYQGSIYLKKVFDDFFKLRSFFFNRVDLSMEEVDLNQFIPQVITATWDHWLIQRRSINPNIIEQHISDKLPHIWMDSLWVEQAVIGILSEVIVATDSNRGEKKILLAVSHDDTSVRFNISALGKYQRYFHNEEPRLVLAQDIAEQHNGQMEVRKTETQLEVILTLPISKNRPVSS